MNNQYLFRTKITKHNYHKINNLNMNLNKLLFNINNNYNK